MPDSCKWPLLWTYYHFICTYDSIYFVVLYLLLRLRLKEKTGKVAITCVLKWNIMKCIFNQSLKRDQKSLCHK
jgi:hypothetical protein